METRYYNADSLARALHAYEERFGLDSRDFYEAHRMDDDAAADIPGFVRHVWAGLYRDFRRLSDEVVPAYPRQFVPAAAAVAAFAGTPVVDFRQFRADQP